MVYSSNPTNHSKPAQTQPMANNQPFLQIPPAYGSTGGYYVVPPPAVIVVREDRNRAGARFCRALFWGIVIWVLLSGLFRSYIELISWHHRRHHGPWIAQWTAPYDYPIPKDVKLYQCTPADGWNELPPRRDLVAETNFNLPLNTDTLYFLARGDMSGGSSTVLIDPSLRWDQVHINVIVHYKEAFVRDLVRVCEVSRSKSERGIGIFTPHYRDGGSRDKHMWFETTISLPSSASENVIKKFETDLPNTVQDLKDLSSYLFKYIELQSSNAPINADSLRFVDGSIRSSNAPISGTFNTTNTLALKTSNGNIKVNVGARASKGSKPRVILSTRNGPLGADISLFSDGTYGEFDIATSSTNSPLGVTIATQPVDAVLHYTGSTTNSPAIVELNPLFEGKFDVHSTIFSPSVHFDSQLPDPSGRGRVRGVSVQNGRRDAYGQAVWGYKRELHGYATLRTTNSPATLHL